MPGPGEYRPDSTEGTTCIGDLPKTKVACFRIANSITSRSSIQIV